MSKAPRVRKYALTYPKCKISKEHAGEILKALPEAKHVVVAEEKHKDGDQHLHAFIHFATQKTRPTEMFDIEGHHGNVQACRCVKDWITYITKEDPEPWTHEFDVGACLKKKRSTLSVARAATMSYDELRTKIRPQDLQRFMAGLHVWYAHSAYRSC